MNKKAAVVLAAFASLFTVGETLAAATPVEVMYAVTGKHGEPNSYLIRITDFATGDYHVVGTTRNMHAVAINADGDMYGISSPRDTPQTLYKINPATGATTPVGTLNGTNASNKVIALTFNGNTLYGWDRIGTELATISTVDASITRTASGSLDACTAIAWSGSTLYYRRGSGFGTIDTTTGVNTETDGSVVDEDGYDNADCRKDGSIASDGYMYSSDGYLASQLIRTDLSDTADVTEKQIAGLHAGILGIATGFLRDTDADGVPDAFEILAGASESTANGDADSDGDGLSNYDEFMAGTAINNSDTDGDGLADADEAAAGTNPLRGDSDGDGLLDGVEVVLGLDPLDGAETAITVDTDAEAGDLRHVGVTEDSDGNVHVFYSRYDDGVSDDVLHYAMLDAAGEIVIAPSLIETTGSCNYPRRPRPVAFSDGTVGVFWTDCGDLYFARVDPSEAPRDGTAVDVLTNTAFLPIAPFNVEDETSSGISTGHAHAVVHDDVVYVAGMEHSGSECLTFARFDQDGVIIGDFLVNADYCDDRADPYLVVDSEGRVHIAFQNGDYTSDYEIWYGVLDTNAPGFLVGPVLISSDNNEESMRPRLVAVGGSGKMMLSYADKVGVQQGSSSGGGDIRYTIIDTSALAYSGDSPSLAQLTGGKEWALNLSHTDSRTWYYEAARDANGRAMLLMIGHGGNSSRDLHASNLYSVRIDENGVASSPFLVSRRTLLDDDSYQWFGGVSTNYAAYVEGDNVKVRKLSSGSTGDSSDADGTATLSKGYFLNFTSLAESDLAAAAVQSLPENFTFEDGFVGFAIGGIEPGDTVAVRLTQAGGMDEDSRYWKYTTADGWFMYPYFQVDGTTIEIALTDGGAGDADGMVNGVIIDPSGLGTYVGDEPPPPAPTPVNVSGGGGGGCVIGDGERPIDPLFPALLALAAVYIFRRRVTN